MSVRNERIAKMMREEIGYLLSRGMSDPRIGFATVTRVEVASDLKSARVYIGVIGDEKQRKSSMIGINHATGFIQHELADKMKMRFTPTLSFILDDGPARSVRISELLDSLSPEQPKDGGGKDDEADDEA